MISAITPTIRARTRRIASRRRHDRRRSSSPWLPQSLPPMAGWLAGWMGVNEGTERSGCAVPILGSGLAWELGASVCGSSLAEWYGMGWRREGEDEERSAFAMFVKVSNKAGGGGGSF